MIEIPFRRYTFMNIFKSNRYIFLIKLFNDNEIKVTNCDKVSLPLSFYQNCVLKLPSI